MVSADVNDLDSLQRAIRGSYGVFGLRNYWDKYVLDKQKEIKQGINIFHACLSEDVTHFVYSTLPFAEKLSHGTLQHVSHFDSKAMVAEQIEASKGDMLVSYFMPAMYFKSAKESMSVIDGELTLTMPFKKDADFVWPFIEPRKDTGKYVAGLFEGSILANGVKVHAVSVWTSPEEVLTATSREANRATVFRNVSPEVYQDALPELVAEYLTQTMLLVGGYSYYVPGEENNQSTHDRWLVRGSSKTSLGEMVKSTRPWQF